MKSLQFQCRSHQIVLISGSTIKNENVHDNIFHHALYTHATKVLNQKVVGNQFGKYILPENFEIGPTSKRATICW